ncbi:unnamed protein product [Paramecium octaurelia]|uniref:Transmembrane protein n=1 Tax=Paramecium octaurelia TaxID=43137 RepID=A0A8S1S2V9_PAROT|nr:unnamed protein product [Paramecium octaurelia]
MRVLAYFLIILLLISTILINDLPLLPKRMLKIQRFQSSEVRSTSSILLFQDQLTRQQDTIFIQLQNTLMLEYQLDQKVLYQLQNYFQKIQSKIHQKHYKLLLQKRIPLQNSYLLLNLQLPKCLLFLIPFKFLKQVIQYQVRLQRQIKLIRKTPTIFIIVLTYCIRNHSESGKFFIKFTFSSLLNTLLKLFGLFKRLISSISLIYLINHPRADSLFSIFLQNNINYKLLLYKNYFYKVFKL